MKRWFNAGMRGLALGARFVLVFALARLLEPADLARFGLLSAAIAYMIYAIGFDFYKYANRELIAAGPEGWKQILCNQGAFYLAAHAVLLPGSLSMFAFGILPLSLMPWFVALVIIEHAGHEIGRVLIAMSDQLAATVTLFLRTGAWVLLAIPLMWRAPDLRSLDTVLVAWAAGGTVACVIGGGRIVAAARAGSAGGIDWRWISAGLQVSFLFLLGTLALKGIATLDRYWVDSVGQLETVAAYVLFVGIANVVKAFLDSGVFVFSYPAMVRAAAKGDVAAFDTAMKAMSRETLWVTLGVVAAALLLIGPLLEWVDRPVYARHLDLFYLSMVAAVLYALGMVAHYGVYAFRMDRTIVTSQIAGFTAFLAATPFFTRWQGPAGVALGVCLGYLVILAIKFSALRSQRQRWQLLQ